MTKDHLFIKPKGDKADNISRESKVPSAEQKKKLDQAEIFLKKRIKTVVNKIYKKIDGPAFEKKIKRLENKIENFKSQGKFK